MNTVRCFFSFIQLSSHLSYRYIVFFSDFILFTLYFHLSCSFVRFSIFIAYIFTVLHAHYSFAWKSLMFVCFCFAFCLFVVFILFFVRLFVCLLSEYFQECLALSLCFFFFFCTANGVLCSFLPNYLVS